ncbi:MAG: putative 7-carboxy-7-deazaguanine synthase QueE [Ruminococcus sp.]|nr:putative 7-carboxy-7-deazaguanine synthase QueE [Ruminococcus sp.]
MSVFPVAEKFVSINGESVRAGEPAVFIRFRGCNLGCGYCDTKWANTPDCPAEMMTAEELAEYVRGTGITDVTLTGGEPLLREGIYELIERLMKNGHRVEIETNGSISVAELDSKPCRPAFTLDYKLPSSGMESAMLTENYRYLKKCDAVKFVSGTEADLEKAAEIIEKFALTEKCGVYISPVFGGIDPKRIVEFMLERKLNGVRLQLQLHKYIWDPEKRGV